MGYGVTDGEEFPALVRQQLGGRFGLDKVDVVNAGMGRGNGYWIKFLKTEAPALHPTLVVLEVCGNDFQDNMNELLFELSHSGELVDIPPLPPPLGRRLQRLAEAAPWLHGLHLFALAKQTLKRSFDSHRAQMIETQQGVSHLAKVSEDLTLALISEALVVAQQHGLEVLMLAVDVDDARLSTLIELSRRHDIPLIEVPRKDDRPDLYFEIDGHWNPAGHRHVAGLVVEHVLANDRFTQRIGAAGR
jgi:hypothetical protein